MIDSINLKIDRGLTLYYCCTTLVDPFHISRWLTLIRYINCYTHILYPEQLKADR